MIGILSAMQVETELLIQKLSAVKTVSHCGKTFYEGTLHQVPCVVLSCGVGKVNAAAGLQMLFDRYPVDCLFHSGIAGAMTDRAGLFSMVLGKSIAYHDMNADSMAFAGLREPFFHSDPALIKKAEAFMQKNGVPYLTGLMVTGDRFINDEAGKNGIIERFPGVLSVDMESAAVAHVCGINSVPFLVVRAISDTADDQQLYDENEKRAAYLSANMTAELVREFAQSHA